MRIIGGQWRGKKITAPESLAVRPTTDFAKTGLFNMLHHRYQLTTIKALDLFSGTGSITYELLSRGCTEIIAIDKNAGCIKFIDQTLDLLHAPSTVFTAKEDAIVWLNNNIETFDIIFADPPFEMEICASLKELIFKEEKLIKDGVFIFEHQSNKDYSQLEHFQESRKYGNVTFSFFK